MYLVNSIDVGTVNTNTVTSTGAILSIITSEPTTVITLLHICNRSFERDAFTVSMS